ncbi:hypothetical protein Y032_0057g2790 [Ancylostoma ceylanicum]|uniref:Uncharacterized protein n=1 Tax=Ancylostoma ceylanicum TaxID=53326 RepID=A0A016U5M9_9BILA|nr:hypothetical protein Y032_0057g2790 [Ancylostoma ceylanicum]
MTQENSKIFRYVHDHLVKLKDDGTAAAGLKLYPPACSTRFDSSDLTCCSQTYEYVEGEEKHEAKLYYEVRGY